VRAALTGGSHRSLVFTRTKHGAQKLTRQLAGAGVFYRRPARGPVAPAEPPAAAPTAGPATGRGAVAMSAGYRGRRRR
jgi:hypothetical protein